MKWRTGGSVYRYQKNSGGNRNEKLLCRSGLFLVDDRLHSLSMTWTSTGSSNELGDSYSITRWFRDMMDYINVRPKADEKPALTSSDWTETIDPELSIVSYWRWRRRWDIITLASRLPPKPWLIFVDPSPARIWIRPRTPLRTLWSVLIRGWRSLSSRSRRRCGSAISARDEAPGQYSESTPPSLRRHTRQSRWATRSFLSLRYDTIGNTNQQC